MTQTPHTPPADPVLPLYEEWCATLAAYRDLAEVNEDWDRPDMEAIMERHIDLGREVSRTIPTTGAGIAALAHVLWENHVGPTQRYDNPQYAANFWEAENRLIYGIWQAASGLPLSAGPFPLPPSTPDLEA